MPQGLILNNVASLYKNVKKWFYFETDHKKERGACLNFSHLKVQDGALKYRKHHKINSLKYCLFLEFPFLKIDYILYLK